MARTDRIGTVYLLHFERPIEHARHYLGWALDVHARVDEHLAGSGARIVRAAVARDIHVELVRTWEGVDRHFERKLKNGRNHRRFCPVCGPDFRRLQRDRKRLYRLLAVAGGQESYGD